jgi:glycine/sarcosine N-methyltransferase
MSLYASLARSYDELFPLPPLAAPFLDALVPPRARARRVLDAGCATGSQALALATLGWEAVGLDSEAAMVDRAAAAAAAAGLSGRASFAVADMLRLGERFSGERFDLVLCLGNTLPHLSSQGVSHFLAEARELLAPGGALVLQLLNYGLPGIGAGYAFPPLSAASLEMRRSYQSAGPDALRFVVELKSGGGSRTEETILGPIAPPRLGSLLDEAGFSDLRRFSGWGGASFDEGRDSYLLVVARPA